MAAAHAAPRTARRASSASRDRPRLEQGTCRRPDRSLLGDRPVGQDTSFSTAIARLSAEHDRARPLARL
jgi:hypothetical protein